MRAVSARFTAVAEAADPDGSWRRHTSTPLRTTPAQLGHAALSLCSVAQGRLCAASILLRNSRPELLRGYGL